MKNILLVFCFLLISLASFGQQFSQYNTGTLYDSFENLSRPAFIPDSSRQFAFNFFIPNFYSNTYVTGDAQTPLKSRAFTGKYSIVGLKFGENKFSRANVSANVYALMFKSFRSLDGNQEVGFSVQTRADGRGVVTDETLLLLNSNKNFEDNVSYPNLFNNNYTYQSYHQFSATYREQVSKTFAFGVKLSALLGIQYQKLQIDQSNIKFDAANDAADLSLQGRYRINFTPGKFATRDLLPSFRNPGASISFGSTIRTRDNFNIQFNVKDIGFIHWYNKSITSDFNTTRTIEDISTRREDNLYANTFAIIRSGDKQGSFVTPTNGKIELSANKSYWFDYDRKFKYSPTLILQKEVFYEGYTAALVNPLQYNNLVGTLTTSYNNFGLFNAGLQFMVKTPNVEFYIGSDRVIETANLFGAARKNTAQINKNASFSGGDFFLGFSLKFGNVIEHPTNATFIPMGEKPGLIKRLWNSIFHHNDDDGT